MEQWLPWWRVGEGSRTRGSPVKGTRELSGIMEMPVSWPGGMVTWVYVFVKTKTKNQLLTWNVSILLYVGYTSVKLIFIKEPNKCNKFSLRSYLVHRDLPVDGLGSLICQGFALLALEDFERLDFEPLLSVLNSSSYQFIEGILKSLIRLLFHCLSCQIMPRFQNNISQR